MPAYDEVRRHLERRLHQLTSRIGAIERDLRQKRSADSGERATERENDEVLERLDESSLAEVRELREALFRMANGTYGVCATCGGAIGETRLKAVPSATTCLSCATG